MTSRNLHLKRLMFSIGSLLDLGEESTSSKDLSAKMKAALYVITGTLSVPMAALFVYHPVRKDLDFLIEKGNRDRNLHKIRLVALPQHIKRFKMNEPHTIRDLADTPFYKHNRQAFTALKATVFLPLFAKEDFVGALTLGRKLGGVPYRQGEKDILRIIAHQMAITMHNAHLFLELAKRAEENKKLYKNMQRIYQDTIQAFAAAIDAKDGYTKDHSYRVASYAVAIAKELGWKKKDLEGIYIAGLLHDIGKIIIDSRVIRKGERLTDVEINEIRKHPQISYDILSKVKFPWKDIENFVHHHHERMDGKGYPDSLRATQLSEGVKILSLVDAFDAMTTDRPYRNRLGLDETFEEVMKCCGTQFDEKITKTFFIMLLRELSGEIKKPQILPLLEHANNEDFADHGSDTNYHH